MKLLVPCRALELRFSAQTYILDENWYLKSSSHLDFQVPFRMIGGTWIPQPDLSGQGCGCISFPIRAVMFVILLMQTGRPAVCSGVENPPTMLWNHLSVVVLSVRLCL